MLSFKGSNNLGSKSTCLRSEKPKPAKFLENVSSTTKKALLANAVHLLLKLCHKTRKRARFTGLKTPGFWSPRTPSLMHS